MTADPHKLKQKFWKTLDESPHLFLQLDADPHSAVPMSAQLDKHAHSAIWFFTRRDHLLAAGGPATATFAGKHHDMFARFSGVLVPETDRAVLDKHWSSIIDAWYPGGKDDPDLVMLRMDLGQAEIWNSDFGFLENTKMLMGFDMREEARDEHLETAL